MNNDRPENIEIYMERNIFDSSIGTYITKRTPEGLFKAKIEWEKVEDGELYSVTRPKPSFIAEGKSRFDKNGPRSKFIRTLMESLDEIGALKKQPETKMLEGELKATLLHLEDMRSLNLIFTDYYLKDSNDE